MRIAIKYEGLDISPSGRVAGHEAGDTLVRRLLRIFPGSTMIAPVPRHSEDLDVVPLEMLDPTELVVINMDAADSPHIWQVLSRGSGSAPGAAPQPQMPVRTEAGVFYADLGWRAAMLAYEIDGEIKYLQDADAALSAQYRRETAIEAAGVHVERATPADVADGEGFLTGLRGVLPQSLCEENPVTALRTPFEIRRQGASW